MSRQRSSARGAASVASSEPAPASAAEDARAAGASAASAAHEYRFLSLHACAATLAAVAAYHAWAAPPSGAAFEGDGLRLMAASFLACATVLAALPRRAPLDARVRVVSTVHAVVASYLSWRALLELVGGRPWASLLQPPSARESARWWFAAPGAGAGEHGWATAAAAVMGGYVAADVAFALVLDPALLDAAMWAHHAIALCSFGSAVALGFAVPYHALVAGTEVSTPFLNFYHTWARAGAARVVNGALLWAAYLAFRVLNIGAVLAHVARTTAAPAVRADARAAVGLPFYITMLVLVFGLNLAWWWAITKILVRALGVLFCGWTQRPSRKKV